MHWHLAKPAKQPAVMGLGPPVRWCMRGTAPGRAGPAHLLVCARGGGRAARALGGAALQVAQLRLRAHGLPARGGYVVVRCLHQARRRLAQPHVCAPGPPTSPAARS